MANILVVDPNSVERRIVRMTLDMDAHRVAEVATAPEALDIVEKYPVDLVILAIDVGEADGYETIHRMRAFPGRESTAIVAVLERDDERGPVDSFLAGAIDILVKPFGSNDVREVVARATSGEEAEKRRARVGRQLEAYETAQRLQEQARAT